MNSGGSRKKIKFNLLKLLNKLGVKSARTKNIVKHIAFSTFYKIGSVIASFMLVPITIDYLDVANYGIWLTLTSFIGFFSFFDIGLGNGLRNKFAEAMVNGNIDDIKSYVSTAYYSMSFLCALVLLGFYILNPFISWSQFFNTDIELETELSLLLPILFTFFVLQLILKLVVSIHQANQNHSIQNKIQFYGQLFSLIVLWILTKLNYVSLLIFGSLYSSIPLLILLYLNIYGFKTSFKDFKPTLSFCKLSHFKDITSLGIKFFILQIASLVLFASDNLIITKLFGPEEVVPYNISYKYFSIVTLVYTIIITPYWSSFTEAFKKKDFNWIKKNTNSIQKIWLLIPGLLLIMVFASDFFINLWIGEKVKIPFYLNLSMAFYIVLLTYNMIYSNFINGVGKIKLNLIFSVISAIINIPLSILFAKHLNIGPTGVILATCFCLLYALPFLPIQYNKIINNNAKGLWNK